MADFVLANPFRAATMHIDELAQAVGASVATANRFARALGYEGFAQFRAALVNGFEATLAPVERLRSAQQSGESTSDVLDDAFARTVANVEATRRALDADAFTAAVDALLKARRIFVIGSGASAFLAGLLEYGLAPYCPNVQSLSLPGGGSHAARRLLAAGAQDLAVAIAFPRYVSDTVRLAERAHMRGCPLLALTDGPTSPLMPYASMAMFMRAERRLGANSDATVLALIEALCDAVAHRAVGSVQAATEFTDYVLPWLVRETHARRGGDHS